MTKRSGTILCRSFQNFSDNTWTVQLVLKDSCQSPYVFLSFCGSVTCFSPTCCRIRACLGLGLQNVDREVVGLKMILVCISLTWIPMADGTQINRMCILCLIVFFLKFLVKKGHFEPKPFACLKIRPRIPLMEPECIELDKCISCFALLYTGLLFLEGTSHLWGHVEL